VQSENVPSNGVKLNQFYQQNWAQLYHLAVLAQQKVMPKFDAYALRCTPERSAKLYCQKSCYNNVDEIDPSLSLH